MHFRVEETLPLRSQSTKPKQITLRTFTEFYRNLPSFTESSNIMPYRGFPNQHRSFDETLHYGIALFNPIWRLVFQRRLRCRKWQIIHNKRLCSSVLSSNRHHMEWRWVPVVLIVSVYCNNPWDRINRRHTSRSASVNEWSWVFGSLKAIRS